MHVLYQVLSYFVHAILWPFLLLHPKLRRGVRKRLGLYDASPRPWPSSRGKGARIWLHGASAGDLLAILPMISELRARSDGLTIIVSTMTNSGFAMAEDRMRTLVDGITYVPYDLPGTTRRAMRIIRPDLLVLEYAELWPNLIEAARAQGAKIALTNGRISERLILRYRILNAVFGNQLQKLDLLLMREEVEAERVLALKAPPDRVLVTGNTKFDHVAKPAQAAQVDVLRRVFDLSLGPLFVAGSTHEGEETVLLTCYERLAKSCPGLRLMIAPRYIERAPRIAAMARRRGLRVMLRSEADASALSSSEDRGVHLRDPRASLEGHGGSPADHGGRWTGHGGSPADHAGRPMDHEDPAERAPVIILDSIGELSSAYALATIVFVGGSFVPRGGQNILEPAGQGRPVLFGPYMMNFRDSVEVLLGRGGIQVQSPGQLEKVAADLLARPHELERLGEMAKRSVEKVRGASARNAELLLDLVERDRASSRIP